MNAQKTPEKNLNPINVYKLLPKTNCKECGEQNCLAYATKLVNREITVEQCKPLLEKMNEDNYNKLKEILKPTIKEVIIGSGAHAVKVGGKLVLHRHELMYSNPTAIAIDVTDDTPEETLLSRIQQASNLHFDYIGQTLKLNMIAIRSTSKDPHKFSTTVKKVIENTSLPLILCAFDANVLEAGIQAAPKTKPLLYAATKNNWKETAELALMYNLPLTIFSPNDLNQLMSQTKTLLEYGVQNLVLDPGTFVGNGLGETISNFTKIRRAAFEGQELCRFPLIGTPMTTWMQKANSLDEIIKWREAYAAAMLTVRYADILILHSLDGWSLLPLLVLRQNLYSDPRKPAKVQPGLKTFGTPNENSPVMFTTNFALTYYTVAQDIEKARLNAYLIIIDTDGIAVDSAVAGRKLTAEKITQALKTSQIENKIKHKKLIIPGKSARLAPEIEKLSGWQVLIGPKDSSDIPKFLQEKWQPQTQTT